MSYKWNIYRLFNAPADAGTSETERCARTWTSASRTATTAPTTRRASTQTEASSAKPQRKNREPSDRPATMELTVATKWPHASQAQRSKHHLDNFGLFNRPLPKYGFRGEFQFSSDTTFWYFSLRTLFIKIQFFWKPHFFFRGGLPLSVSRKFEGLESNAYTSGKII